MLLLHINAKVKQRSGQLGAKHVEAALDLARSGQNGSSLALPGGVEARKERDALVFRAAEKVEGWSSESTHREYEYKIDLAKGSAEVNVAELGCVFRLRVIDWPPKRGETSSHGAVLDRDRVRFPMLLRNWRPGGRWRPDGRRNGHKL